MIDTLVQDTRFALRTLRRNPGFTLTAVLTLALGIGVNIAMLSLVNGLLLRPLYERPEEVVAVYGRGTTPAGEYRAFSYPNYVDVRDGTDGVFANLAAYSTTFAGLDLGEGSRRTLASAVTANYFRMFGLPLTLGRPFTAEEERPGADIRVAIVSYALWERRGDAGMLGRTVRINGEHFTVVGVAPRGFTGTSIPGPELWLPLGAQRTLRAKTSSAGPPADARAAHELTVVGRLQTGVSPEALTPALAAVGRRLEQGFPAVNASYTIEHGKPTRLLFMPGPGSATVTASLALTLMVMPAIVLLVACLNLVDLLLARGQVRRQEMAIRSSLGGGRWRLIRQLVTEGLLLALAGGVVGLLLSVWATNAVTVAVQPVLPVGVSLPPLGLDWRVFTGTVGFSLAATLLFGAWPAWVLAGRTTAEDIKGQIAEEGRRRSCWPAASGSCSRAFCTASMPSNRSC